MKLGSVVLCPNFFHSLMDMSIVHSVSSQKKGLSFLIVSFLKKNKILENEDIQGHCISQICAYVLFAKSSKNRPRVPRPPWSERYLNGLLVCCQGSVAKEGPVFLSEWQMLVSPQILPDFKRASHNQSRHRNQNRIRKYSNLLQLWVQSVKYFHIYLIQTNGVGWHRIWLIKADTASGSKGNIAGKK